MPQGTGFFSMHTLRCGIAVPPRFNGSVVSVHPGETPISNVLLQDEWGPFIVSLITSIEHMTAGSLLLSQDVIPLLNTLTPGTRVSGSATHVMIYPVESTPVTIPRDGTRWSGEVQRNKESSKQLFLPALVDELSAYLQHHSEMHHGLAPLLLNTILQEPLTCRARGILDATPPDNIPAGLIGLGPGFTPAGDDFLMGVLAVEALSHRDPGRFQRSVVPRLTSTTAGGATLLRHALSRSFPFYFHQVCDILVSSETDLPAIAEGAWHKASTHGHSSGVDALSGFIWALRRNNR